MSKLKNSKADLEGEDMLQAILIADSFDTNFHPLTLDVPKALVPFINNNFIEYSLEALAIAGIQETFVFCCNYVNEVVRYLENSKWMNGKCQMKVHTIVSENCSSVGEALRDMSGKDVIRREFVLLYADTIFNFNLLPVIKAHKERKLQSNATLTMVLKETHIDHPSKIDDRKYFHLNEQEKRVLKFRNMDKPSHRLLEYTDLTAPVSIMKFNLLNCQISICSPSVLDIMVDHFDLQSIDGLIVKILDDDPILGGGIYYHLLKKNEYASRVTNFQSYEITALDVINRWAYPLVPDNNISNCSDDNFVFHKSSVYLHARFANSNESSLVKNVVICEGVALGKDTNVSNSVIGKNCRIGNNVTISGCFIFDGVEIGDGCMLSNCFVAGSAHIGSNTNVPDGCVIGSKVKILSTDNLSTNTRLVASPMDGSLEALPSKGGYVYFLKSTDHKNDDESDYEDDEEDSDSSSSSTDGSDVEEYDDNRGCYDEIMEHLIKYRSGNNSLYNNILELNSVKHSFGMPIRNLKVLLMRALLDLPLVSNSFPSTATSYFSKFTNSMERLLPLLRSHINSPESERDALAEMEDAAMVEPEILKSFALVCNFFYEQDILSEEVILAWWKDESREHNPALEKQMNPLINWLETAEEDSSDDSE